MLLKKSLKTINACLKRRQGTLRSSSLSAILWLLLGDVVPPPEPLFEVELFQDGFNLPVVIRQAPDNNDRFYVVEKQSGLLKTFIPGGTVTTMMDLNQIETPNINFLSDSGGGERGFLGLTFDPDYATNRHFYVYYSANPDPAENVNHQSIVSRFTRDVSDPTDVDMSSEEVIMRINQPYGNHNGGFIEFGPDGNLFIGLGDGGSGGDPDDNGQDKTGPLGSILRIDVSSLPYTIPPTNPFTQGALTPGDDCTLDENGFCAEIFLYGVRNPWRFSFDNDDGDLWIGDVGQGAREEISRIDIGDYGDEINLGWDCREGSIAYSGNSSMECDSPDVPFLDPVTDYVRSGFPDDCSVTGGYVYRGQAISAMQGLYFFADYCTGIVRSVSSEAPLGSDWVQHSDLPFSVASFGQDNTGELYLLDLFGGQVFKIVAPETE